MIDHMGKVLEKVPIKDYTTYKLSGTLSKVIYPETLEQLVTALKYCQDNQLKYLILGNGSNVIFVHDYNGIVIKLDHFNNLTIDGNLVKVGAGYSLMALAFKTVQAGLAGLDFAAGIPATVGGAIYMNAGAYQAEISDVLQDVTILDENFSIRTLKKEELEFGYRSSLLRKTKWIVLEATFVLMPGQKQELLQIIKERQQKRLMTQPLEYPSAGSVFRNPENDYAGRLIEQLELKGQKIGGALISQKHANFIVNDGTASGEDIKTLINYIQAKVKEAYGIDLIVEQEFIE